MTMNNVGVIYSGINDDGGDTRKFTASCLKIGRFLRDVEKGKWGA